MKAEELDKAGWKYCDDVIDGTIPAGELIIAACKRARAQLLDPTLTYDPIKAVKPAQFAGYLRHLKGPLAGEPVTLEPWQIFMITQIYGWIREDGRRLVRSVYIEVPRKNGKSTLCSVLALYHLLADGEASAEVYSSAITRDQARIVFGDAQAMTRGSPQLNKHLGVQRSSIFHTKSNSKFEPLSSDAGTLEGKNPSFSVVDELHTHKTSDVWDVLNVASGARAQPIIFGITTAGTNREGIAYQLRV